MALKDNKDNTGTIKVVFIINNFLVGGVELLMLDILSRLDRSKLDVHLVTVFGSGPLETEFRRLGVPIYTVGPGVKRRLPFKLYWVLVAPFTLARLWILLAKIKPRVVITSLYQADLLGILAARLAGVRERIFIQHDVIYFTRLRRVLRKNIPIRLATRIVAVSQTAKEFLVEKWSVPPEKVAIIRNGIDLDNLKQGAKPAGGPPVIGMIGRLESVKGPEVLLKAVKILKEERRLEPDVIFGGAGSMQPELEQYAQQHRLNKVKFLGPVPDFLRALRQMDIYVVPSHSEGFGLSALAGLASRKAVVVSDIPALRELVSHGKNGLVFREDNAEVLADTLHKLLTDKKLLASIKRGAGEWLAGDGKKFDISKTARLYQEFITGLA